MAGDVRGQGDELEDDEEALLEQGDPIAALIDKIESVKTSFEQFSKGLKDEGLADDDDEDDEEPNDTDMSGDMPVEDMDMEKKIERFESLLERLSEVVSRMEATENELGFAQVDAGEDEDDEDDDDDDDDYASLGNNPVVTEYEALIQRLLVPFLDAVNGIGGEVQKQGAFVAQVFGAQREMLAQVSRMTQPTEDDFMQMLESTNEALGCIDQVNEDAEDLRKHTAMVAGAMTAFGWVTSPDPRQYIGDMLNAVPVYGRQILSDFPGEEHQALVEALKLLLRGLQEYVSKYHPHGLAWNARNFSEEGTGAAAQAHSHAPKGSSHRPAFTSDREAKLDFTVMLSSYGAFLADKVTPFIEAAYALEREDVRAQADFVQQAFKAQHRFMRVVAACRRPGDEEIQELLIDTSEALMEIEERCNIDSEERHHLALVAAGMPALAWVRVCPPHAHARTHANARAHKLHSDIVACIHDSRLACIHDCIHDSTMSCRHCCCLHTCTHARKVCV
jgi:hypothetical protein